MAGWVQKLAPCPRAGAQGRYPLYGHWTMNREYSRAPGRRGPFRLPHLLLELLRRETTPVPSPPHHPSGIVVETTLGKTAAEYFESQCVRWLPFSLPDTLSPPPSTVALQAALNGLHQWAAVPSAFQVPLATTRRWGPGRREVRVFISLKCLLAGSMVG